MKRRQIILLQLLAAFFVTCPTMYGQFAGTGTTTLSVAVGPEAALQVTTATTTLATTGTIFNNYTGTTNLTYKIRTTKSTGSGTITLKVTTDFSGSGSPSPSVATPPSAGDTLAYTCTVVAPGTGCSTSTNASTTAATNVATFGAGASSALAGNAASTVWTLTNDPTYGTGTYTATVTYTISAL
jgi:hypothetical protein